MPTKLTLQSPAKINLWLQIGPRLASGYHDVQNIMVKIPLYDKIICEFDENLSILEIECDEASVPTDERNLVARAYQALARRRRLPGGRVRLEKKIPAGAGLGGGSMNAGVFLAAVNRHFRLGYSDEQLAVLAEELGADVPFGVSESLGTLEPHHGQKGQTTWDLPGLPECQIVLVYQDFSLETAAMYAEWDHFIARGQRPAVAASGPALMTGVQGGDLAAIGQNLHNDFLLVLLEKYPYLNKIFEQLLAAGAAGASFTGKGPTIFALFDKDKKIDLPFKFDCLSIESKQ
ncbi:4-(cytidine 5'-diphospho)-2-C-methyl-D-erythritol kinase [bacterium]|nr:4-(cytidine 5'-diphospho)-2-C-methyl-D-erythritol kinase [bacterium]